mmetsp:Transcript_20242/g.42457  ORF Transcript_20242/g.42457 Transcript_20242/m.42457 type:complete len:80 (+) Transcript_20242:2620-2859(+)
MMFAFSFQVGLLKSPGRNHGSILIMDMMLSLRSRKVNKTRTNRIEPNRTAHLINIPKFTGTNWNNHDHFKTSSELLFPY